MEELVVAVVYLVLGLVFSVGPILLALVVGRIIESAHKRSLREREARLRHIVVTNTKVVPEGVVPESPGELVRGDVVIAPDYFKMWIAGLKTYIGGELGSLVSLMERARRESLLRMKEEAHRKGADFVINVRFETSNLRQQTQQGGERRGAAIVEMLCYGTAFKRAG